MSRVRRRFATLLGAFLVTAPVWGFDLSPVVIERLDNGLTVLVLEEHDLPVVSVQMLYKVGARDEAPGRTGLAHFVEHMAFRASENFPENDVVRRIYAVGGEWHGYTWIDQTTYYATVPREHLDLLLAIEADRMSSLVMAADEVEAERGAVMAELRGYEEDPASVLVETVAALSFLQHPYRYNSIGWPSDVEAIEHADLVDFYRRHYVPANGVLAVVGDVETGEVLEQVRARFGGLPSGRAAPLPRTVEPPQRGERRVVVRGETERALYEIGYRAPAVGSPDWPAFLLLQAVLGGSGGVNFLQDTFGTAVRAGSRLDGVASETWLSPAAQPYLYTVSGSVDLDADRTELEATIEGVLERLRKGGVTPEELVDAKRQLAAELVFDLETTEDAAHQLAFFAGLEALDVLLTLEQRLEAVTPADVQAAAERYLQPWQRTVAWYLPERPGEGAIAASVGLSPAPPERVRGDGRAATASEETGRVVAAKPVAADASALEVHRLSNGLPIVVRASHLSPAAHLRVVFPGTGLNGAAMTADEPLWDHTSLGRRSLAAELDEALARTRQEIDRLSADGDPSRSALERALERTGGATRRPQPSPRPRAVVLVGDLDPLTAVERLEDRFGDLAVAAARPSGGSADSPEVGGEAAGADSIAVDRLPARPSGRARLGYAVPAPPPAHPDWPAWRMLLYVMTHGYEGRIGHAAIHQRGLAYYVDSSYESDGRQGWIGIRVSAEPDKIDALVRLVRDLLEELRERPPTAAEVDEARRHLLGRQISAAQSNEEISARLARELIWFGEPLGPGDLEARLDPIGVAHLERIVPAFLGGRLIVEPVARTAESCSPPER